MSSDLDDPLVRLWRGYSAKVYGPDYPLYQALAAAVSENRELIDLIRSCQSEAHDPNMLLAAIQYLVLGGTDDPLAVLYSDSRQPDAERLSDVPGMLDAFWRRHRDELVRQMNSRHIQTNETARCSGLVLGLAAAADRLGEPIGLIDDGASAGLNLTLDEYLIDFGPAGQVGPAGSPVRLSCELFAPVPARLMRIPTIGRRVGIDRAPIDLNDPDAVRWMLACIWPGRGRQDRARAAISLQIGRAPLVRTGDMVEDLAPALKEMRDIPTVVITSWSYSYLPLAARDEFLEVLVTEGHYRPIAWVCCDLFRVVPQFVPEAAPPDEVTPSVLGLALFDRDQASFESLAFMHSHGSWLAWLGGA